jgi:NAD(P)-dependent dehydrogenase (short-subunit alcohol dehydrogenase family)
MRIILVGASGVIGQAIAHELGARHEIIRAGRNGADVKLDMKDGASVEKMFTAVGKFDALVSAAGHLHFGPLPEMKPEHFQVSLADKLMGQINLVVLGQSRIAEGGSFTLTSGILSHDPIPWGAQASMVNNAIDGFVVGAAIELARRVRINSVSPTLVTESVGTYGEYFRGFKTVPVADVALAYAKSVEGAQTGRTYRVG